LGGGKVDCFNFSLTACGPEEGDDNSLSREKVEPCVCLCKSEWAAVEAIDLIWDRVYKTVSHVFFLSAA